MVPTLDPMHQTSRNVAIESTDRSIKFIKDFNLDGSNDSFVQIRKSNNRGLLHQSSSSVIEAQFKLAQKFESIKNNLNKKYEDEPKVFDEYYYPKKNDLIRSQRVLNNIIVAKNPNHIKNKI